MTYQVTVAAGKANVVLPDGLRHKAGDVVVLSDSQYSSLSAAALSSLVSGSSLGGEASYACTVAAGKHGVVLPDGIRHLPADVAVLSDVQYELLTAGAVATLLSSVVQEVT